MSIDIHVTTEILYKGTVLFALLDAISVPLLAWHASKEAFRKLRGSLAIAAALVWFGIWSWAIGNYWEAVYSYVFPGWIERWVPWIAFFSAGAVALGLWALAIRICGNPVLTYCLLGGAIGSLTHLWAVHLGIVTKPPMLQGASPFAAVVIAFFEFLFYWCTILVLARLIHWMWDRWQKDRETGKEESKI